MTGLTGSHVNVNFDASGERTFEHADRPDGHEPRFVLRSEHEGAFGRSAATILGGQLESDGTPKAAMYRSSLHHIPAPFLRALKQFGTQIVLTQDPVGVREHDLADVQPRGYPQGKTWRDASGAYRPDLKRAVIGNTVGSGSTDVALHETGHALDHALGYPSRQEDYKAAYREAATALGDDLKPYYGSAHPDEDAARSEFFAETMAAWAKNEDDAPRERADAMLAAVAPHVSATAVQQYKRAAERFPSSRLARNRAIETTLRNEAAAEAMAKIAAIYQAQVAETEKRLRS